MLNNTCFTPSLVVVRGGGDLATGSIQKLWHCGFHILILEVQQPLTIRRSVALSTAMDRGIFQVEDVIAQRVEDVEACEEAWAQGRVALLADPTATCLNTLHPVALVDAILAKRNLGTRKDMAPVTIALGPGFSAPEDVDCVVETLPGHSLGRVITHGSAVPNIGVKGLGKGDSQKRVVHSPLAGLVRHVLSIGQHVTRGETLFVIGTTPVPSPLSGVLRGLIADGVWVRKGLKCADVDPGEEALFDCACISDKARTIGGGVLEALIMTACRKGLISINVNNPSIVRMGHGIRLGGFARAAAR